MKKNSMALIYDNASDPKVVYRLQKQDGSGPYNPLPQLDDFIHQYSPAHHPIDKYQLRPLSEHELNYTQAPSPERLHQYDEEEFNESERKVLYSTNDKVLFGFESPYDAVIWFGDVTLEKAYQMGFKIYKILADKVYRSSSNRQVMFIPHKNWKETARPMKLESVLTFPRKGVLPKKSFRLELLHKISFLCLNNRKKIALKLLKKISDG